MSFAHHPTTFLYQIDAADKLVFVDEPWLSFARENDAAQLTRAVVLQQPLWNYITDAETRHLYQAMLARVRTDAIQIKLPFRCDSPTQRRFMEMAISQTADGFIQFDTRIVKQEQREPVGLLDIGRKRSDEILTMCGWCKKVEVRPEQWLEAEEAVAHLKLFDSRRLPQLSHGICDLCSEDGWLELAA